MWDAVQGLVEVVINFMGEEQFWGILATGIATLWAWGQRKIGVERKQGQIVHRALSFLEAGVAKTYQEYVKARKKANEDGKLTEEEARTAREMAFGFAKQYAHDNGLDLVKALGADMIPVLLEKTVGGLKREAGGSAVPVVGTGDGTNKPAQKPAVNHPSNVDGYGGLQT
jgi:hypothetical protein